MLRKISFISLLVLTLLCISTTLFSQTNEDAVIDTTTITSDTTINEKYVDDEYKEDEIKAVFNNVNTDTAMVVARTAFNDTITRLKKLKEYNYPFIAQQKKKEPTDYSFWRKLINALSSPTASFILWAIIIGFMVTVIVLYALDNNIGVFAKRGKRVQTNQENDIAFNDIFSINYDAEIQKAFGTDNFNLAARLGFLKLLTQLNSKKLIDYGIEKTNFDYQFQLINTKYYQAFLLAASNYEYAWYSGYVLNANQYQQIAKNYKNLEAQLTY